MDPVLLIVLSFQVVIFACCLILARRDDSEALDNRWKQFKHDIIARARRGDGPDWVRYMDEADRVHERRVDQLRVLATVALVVGIGGTMAALAPRFGTDVDTDDLRALVAAVRSALFASLSGVVNNLIIMVGLFRLSDRRFDEALGSFRQALQKCSDANPPQGQFADAVREQLGQAFREAVRSFPEAFARLDESVTHLAQVTTAQSQSMVTAAAGLRGGVDDLAGAVAKIMPVAELLHGATSELRTVPDQLRQTLDQTRTAWAQEMRCDEEAFVAGVRQVLDDQCALLDRTRDAFHQWERGRSDSAEQQQTVWRETVELMQKTSAEIAGTVERLPDAFTREVERISGKLGKEFSLGAQQHVADLRKEIGESNRTIGEQMEASSRELQNRFLNDTRRVVGESAEEVHRRVGAPLLSALQAVSRGVEEALSTLPENAATFAASLSAADEKLRRAVDRLDESAGHLQHAAKLTEDFESALARALENATVRSFEPVRREMKEFTAELGRVAERAAMSGPEPSTGFFRRLFRRPWRRRADGLP